MAASLAQKPVAPALSRSSVEMLLDLVEIRLGCVEVYDREDRRELRALERARAELSALLGRKAPTVPAQTGRAGRPAAVRFAA